MARPASQMKRRRALVIDCVYFGAMIENERNALPVSIERSMMKTGEAGYWISDVVRSERLPETAPIYSMRMG